MSIKFIGRLMEIVTLVSFIHEFPNSLPGDCATVNAFAEPVPEAEN